MFWYVIPHTHDFNVRHLLTNCNPTSLSSVSWEQALQLRRDVLPVLEPAGVKLFAVGIGSHGSAREFAEALDFPAELLLADESEDVLAHAAAGTRNTRRDENGKAVFEGVESMWSGKTTAAIEARGRVLRKGEWQRQTGYRCPASCNGSEARSGQEGGREHVSHASPRHVQRQRRRRGGR